MKHINWLFSGLLIFTATLFAATALGGGDADGDGVADNVDNCSQVANANQRDTDGDGFGNICDTDLNNNNITNAVDLGIFKSRFFTTDPDADFNGGGIVNTIDLGILKTFFFLPPGPGPVLPSVTYTNDVQPILFAKCAPCHTGLSVGGHDVGTNYTDSLAPASDADCSGQNVGQCSLILIQNGEMPQGAGCTGDPALDAGNGACLTGSEQATVQAWLDAGQPE